jgi:hypothetical protein
MIYLGIDICAKVYTGIELNSMTALAREILNSFDRLPDTDQLEIALEILKRLANFDFPPLADEDLALNAEELFLALDQQEANYE